ncbi:MAG: hypothetical protein AB2693_01565 [Candidatus Thiodiazotropha sp.]
MPDCNRAIVSLDCSSPLWHRGETGGLESASRRNNSQLKPSGWRGEIDADPLTVWRVPGPAANAATFDT